MNTCLEVFLTGKTDAHKNSAASLMQPALAGKKSSFGEALFSACWLVARSFESLA
jgi:hypothetical protein